MKKFIIKLFIIFIINNLFSKQYNIKKKIFKKNEPRYSIINIKKNFIIKKASEYSINNNNIKKNEEYAIIFIHGTYEFNIMTLIKILYYKIFNKKKLKALFKEIEKKRFNQNINTHKAICSNQKGLEKIDFQKSNLHPAYKYIETNLKQPFNNYLGTDNIHYYAFNWGGILSESFRKKESLSLYHELRDIQKNKPNIKFIIISFSHGGNIALELQNIEKKYKKNFFIELLILIATPISITSKINAEGECIKKIINIFSSKDIWQISDLTVNFPYTTQRTLPNTNKNVINADVRFTIYKKKNKKEIIIYPKHKYLGSVISDNSLTIFYTLIPYILEKIKIFYNKNNKNKNLIINIPIKNIVI